MSEIPATTLPSSASPAHPRHAFSHPVSAASYNCPKCKRPVRFKSRPDLTPSLDKVPLLCGCGQILGRYRVKDGGMVWLQVIAPPGTGQLMLPAGSPASALT